MKSTKQFTESMQVFEQSDIEKFTEPTQSFYCEQLDVYVEHRISKLNGSLCIIYFYPTRGYDIYELKQTNYR